MVGKTTARLERLMGRANRLVMCAGLSMVLVSGGLALAPGFGITPAKAQDQIDFPPPGATGGGFNAGPKRSSRAQQPSASKSLIVDPSGGGNYRTIQGALNAARAGASILVRPSPVSGAVLGAPYTFRENLVIKRPVTLASAIPGQKIVLQPETDRACLTIAASTAGLVNISDLHFIKPTSNYRSEPCVEMNGGVLNFLDSEINGTVHHAGLVLSGGFSRVENVKVTNAASGIRIDFVQGADYFIAGTELANNVDGIRINGPAQPKVLDSLIYNNLEHGIVTVGGGGSFVGNQIFRNGGNGVFLQENLAVAPVQFRANDIFENGQSGIRLRANASGNIGANRIFNNQGLAIAGLAGTAAVTQEPPNSLSGNIDGLSERPRSGRVRLDFPD